MEKLMNLQEFVAFVNSELKEFEEDAKKLEEQGLMAQNSIPMSAWLEELFGWMQMGREAIEHPEETGDTEVGMSGTIVRAEGGEQVTKEGFERVISVTVLEDGTSIITGVTKCR